MVAVITADFIDSSLYEEAFLNKVLNTLQKEAEHLKELYGTDNFRFEIYRGDSFQGVLRQPEKALEAALQLKAAINKMIPGETSSGRAKSSIADFKVAIGIGTLELERESIAESNGQAFQFSGRTLDEMKNENQRTKIKTADDDINGEFNTSFCLMDLVTEKWSTASAEVIYYLLKGMKEREIAEEIKISQSAVNQRKKASGWEAISTLLERYESVIKMKFRR